MKRNWQVLLSVAIVVFGLAVAATDSLAQAPAVTPQQIEADWLRQDELRGSEPVQRPGLVKPEEDAAGGVDGAKDGKWGFHTLNEPNPWWQVDLGGPATLDRVVLYNRCDECAGRNARILVLGSDDAKRWKQLYQHDGSVFYGKTDGKPLVARLSGDRARYVRLQLPGTSYFHLDEVEIYAADSNKNVALGRPATQSSTSQWSVAHKSGVKEDARSYATAEVIRRGRLLAAALKKLGASIDADAAELERVASQLAELPADSPEAERRQLYFAARWTVRRMALANPLLDFDKVLFVKRVPPAFPHMSDQYYGWWSRGGGGIYVLEGVGGGLRPFPAGDKGTGGEGRAAGDEGVGRVHRLTSGWEEGSFLRPDLSYDGRRVLFAYCKFYPTTHALQDKVNKENLPEDAFYHIYEMDVDGGGVRRLTRGKYDDFDARYLPDGRIVFLSTRKGRSIQVGCQSAAATARQADLPDSYVRCGGGNSRPVPVFTLHTMDVDGGDLKAISAFENFEWTPSVAADGRILYARWDYIDRFNGPFMSLWSTNPDGTNPQLVYGNFTVKPQCVFEARPVPGSSKLVFTAAAHHSNMGGSLVLLDRRQGTEMDRPLERLTPEVCFPETEGWPRHYYANPFPLSEQFFLVAWSDKGLPPHTFVTDDRNPVNPTGIYLYDAFGNLELLHRDPEIGSFYPLPVRSRDRAPSIPSVVDWGGPQEGRLLLKDVYRGLGDVEPASIGSLRVIAVPPKVQPHMNQPVLGVSREDPGKFVLGTVPVEADGSAYFRVPSGVSIFVQALDRQGMAVQTMRSLTYVQPNQTLSCIGCHESRESAPAVGHPPLAALREPSRLVPGPEGSWPLRFDELVEPVLQRHCVSCHRPDGEDTKAARLDLTPGKAYDALLDYAEKDLYKLAFERDRSKPGEMPARRSRLMALLTQPEGHEGARLDAESRERLATWMDVYAQRLGHFSDQQEAELRALRQQWAEMIAVRAEKP